MAVGDRGLLRRRPRRQHLGGDLHRLHPRSRRVLPQHHDHRAPLRSVGREVLRHPAGGRARRSAGLHTARRRLHPSCGPNAPGVCTARSPCGPACTTGSPGRSGSAARGPVSSPRVHAARSSCGSCRASCGADGPSGSCSAVRASRSSPGASGSSACTAREPGRSELVAATCVQPRRPADVVGGPSLCRARVLRTEGSGGDEVAPSSPPDPN